MIENDSICSSIIQKSLFTQSRVDPRRYFKAGILGFPNSDQGALINVKIVQSKQITDFVADN